MTRCSCGSCKKCKVSAWKRANRAKVKAWDDAYRKKNWPRIKARQAEWQRNNRQKIKQYHMKALYGLTEDDYQRLLKQQKGVCAICKTREKTRDRAGKVKRLSVDHCHKTQTIRGLLCRACNTAIGLLKDDPKLLRYALQYLSR